MSADGLACFKAYDIRGRVPDELNPQLANKIGRAFSEVVAPKRVVVGHDIRLSGPEITAALTEGLTASGVDVTSIGQCGTEEIYHATAHLQADGGIMVTASHNPQDYNGMKLVRAGAVPISGDSGLKEIERKTIEANFSDAATPGRSDTADVQEAYIKQLLSVIEVDRLKPLKIVVNGGNGSAGPTIDRLERHLPFALLKVHHEPDGHFPNGVPNPLLPENRSATADRVKAEGADFGVAWDGDFDRCFLFDESGNFVEGYYIVGLLAERLLARHPGSKIIHDPRLTWNTVSLVSELGGTPIVCKTGHAFIKERMRAEDALYGGEMSAHHYFRDFYYCDSGMLPWLLIAEAISGGQKLSELVAARMARFPTSGEINRRIADPAGALAAAEARYRGEASNVDKTDGVSLEFADWRFNLRRSNTEPLVRLNLETRADPDLLLQKTDELLALLAEFSGDSASS